MHYVPYRPMRLLNFEWDGERRLGALDGDTVVDLSRTGLPGDTIELISQWDRAKAGHALGQGERMPIVGLRLLAPLLPLKNVIAVGRNYRDHAMEFSDSGFDASEKEMTPEHPVIFLKAPTSVIGPGDSIILANDPTASTDYEGEMAVVIGLTARNVSDGDALKHVFGWTIVNDVTARELQERHVQWFVGKRPDTFCPLGPVITTRDELPDIGASWLRTTVNGELRQEAPISGPYFRHADIDRHTERGPDPRARRCDSHRDRARGGNRVRPAAIPEDGRRGGGLDRRDRHP